MFESFKSGKTDSVEIAKVLTIVKSYLDSEDEKKEMFAINYVGKMEERFISSSKIKRDAYEERESILTMTELTNRMRLIKSREISNNE